MTVMIFCFLFTVNIKYYIYNFHHRNNMTLKIVSNSLKLNLFISVDTLRNSRSIFYFILE